MTLQKLLAHLKAVMSTFSNLIFRLHSNWSFYSPFQVTFSKISVYMTSLIQLNTILCLAICNGIQSKMEYHETKKSNLERILEQP